MSDQNQNNGQTKVVVDQNTCIGCGVCAALCADVFNMSTETGKAEVKSDANHSDPCAKESEAACPVMAITVN